MRDRVYSNGPANTQYPADSFVTYCFVSCFLLPGAFPLFTYFKTEIQWTFQSIKTIIKCIYFSIVHVFEISYGLYGLWKELQQLQSQDQQQNQLRTDNLLVQTSPPHEELITEVRELLIQPLSTDHKTPLQESQQHFQVSNIEYSLDLHIPSVSIERIHYPLVVHND